jgi:hypothetical protein
LAVFSNATTRMRSFLYRFPRLKAHLPMDLIVGSAVVLGHCLDISESGLRGTFADSVPSGTEGLLTLYRGEQSIQVHARVNSFHGDEARLRFRYDSDQEREAVRSFLTLLRAGPPAD